MNAFNDTVDTYSPATREVRTAILAMLDSWYQRLQSDQSEDLAVEAISSIVSELADARPSYSESEWYEVFAPACRRHKISDLLLQDPYTARALEKPRGFAGDARLLDFIYDVEAPPGTTALGRALLGATARSPSGLSVDDRRGRLADALRLAGVSKPGASVLSIACGHLREMESLSESELRSLSEIVAVDQDPIALERVEREKPVNTVRVVEGTVRDIVAGRLDIGRHDLVYAAGLFDYLSDFVSVRLLRKMLAAVSPGGRLLVGNFTPGNWGRSYMDVFMDWRLEYRTPSDLRLLGREAAAPGEVRIERVYADSLDNIAYLDLTKA